MMHIALSVPVVFATLLAELSFWRIARKDGYWRRYAKFSIAIFTANLLAGLSLIVFANSDIRGLLERVSIGSFLVWTEILTLRLYRRPKLSWSLNSPLTLRREAFSLGPSFRST